jgi:hypothetical protein
LQYLAHILYILYIYISPTSIYLYFKMPVPALPPPHTYRKVLDRIYVGEPNVSPKTPTPLRAKDALPLKATKLSLKEHALPSGNANKENAPLGGVTQEIKKEGMEAVQQDNAVRNLTVSHSLESYYRSGPEHRPRLTRVQADQ